MTNPLVSEEFNIPNELKSENFLARKLLARDVYLDYMAVISNVELIRKTRGGTWPSSELSFEDDFIDLCWHQREFENKTSFAYTVMSKDQTECLGCFYLYPAGFRKEAPSGSDVDVSFWVTQKAYKNGLYEELYFSLRKWLKKKWQFKKPHWTNQEIPTK